MVGMVPSRAAVFSRLLASPFMPSVIWGTVGLQGGRIGLQAGLQDGLQVGLQDGRIGLQVRGEG